MIRNFVFFLVIFFNSLFLLVYKKNETLNPIQIIIEPGSQLNQISNILFDNGLIKNKLIFNLWVKVNLSEKKLKFGEYLFNGEFSTNSILQKLVIGKSFKRKLTIIEGWSKNDLLLHLNNLNPNNKLIIDNIPDLLIADTYFYELLDNPEDILDNIVSRSKKYAVEIWEKRDRTIPLKNISEMFTLASIVEKETAIKEEKPLISGVFFNRLNKNMRLQSDPTVVFAITLGKRKMQRKLLRKDLKFKSKFNTYINKGLPPESICIPGLESLKSVANPLKSDFLYFVSNNINGEHIFSKNYKEHLKNIKSVRKLKKNYE